MDSLLNKIWNPDYTIVLSYPDDSLTRSQRLLANLARIGKNILIAKNNNPFVSVKEKDSNSYLVNDSFTISRNVHLNSDTEFDYFVDFVCDPDDDRTMYSCLYKNTNTPILFFEVIYSESSIQLDDIAFMNGAKEYILNKYKDYFQSSENGLILIQDINLITKQWSIKVL